MGLWKKQYIYIKQPPGFVDENADLVCLLKKSLYGLKQSARCWSDKLHQALIDEGFVQSNADPCLYMKHEGNDFCYLLVYVDDIALASKSKEMIENVKKSIAKKFKIENLGIIKNYLGLEIGIDKNGFYQLNQKTYINKILSDFNMNNSKNSVLPLNTEYGKDKDISDLLPENGRYRKLIGCLLYLAVNTRPDISACVSILAQKTKNEY